MIQEPWVAELSIGIERVMIFTPAVEGLSIPASAGISGNGPHDLSHLIQHNRTGIAKTAAAGEIKGQLPLEFFGPRCPCSHSPQNK